MQALVIIPRYFDPWISLIVYLDGELDRAATNLAVFDIGLRVHGTIDFNPDGLSAIRTSNNRRSKALHGLGSGILLFRAIRLVG
jgi:hypothetical protein